MFTGGSSSEVAGATTVSTDGRGGAGWACVPSEWVARPDEIAMGPLRAIVLRMASGRTGLARWSSMPATRHLFRSAIMALAVMATMIIGDLILESCEPSWCRWRIG